MMIQEFKTRTEKFLPAALAEDYANSFEPAYMATASVPKDEFCAVLKDETVRKIIMELSAELVKREAAMRESYKTVKTLREQIAQRDAQHADDMNAEHEKVDTLLAQLRLVQSMCDRALSTK